MKFYWNKSLQYKFTYYMKLKIGIKHNKNEDIRIKMLATTVNFRNNFQII